MITFNRRLLDLRDEALGDGGSTPYLTLRTSPGWAVGTRLLYWHAFVEYLLCAKHKPGTVMPSPPKDSNQRLGQMNVKFNHEYWEGGGGALRG